MRTSMVPVLRSLSFSQIVDVPFETCVAAVDSWLRTGHGGGLRFGGSQLLGLMEHDRDLGTRRLQVRLARDHCTRRCVCGWTSTAGPHRPPQWSSSLAGSSGPPRITSGPAASCLTR